MQMENRDFEESLARLEPVKPSARLKERLTVSLNDAPESEPAGEVFDKSSASFSAETAASKEKHTRGKIVWGTTFTALVSAMAAVWTVILVLDYRAEPPRMGSEGSIVASEQPASFEVGARPINQYATLIGATPSPVYYLEDGQAVQKVALRYMDTEVWEVEDSEQTVTVSSYRDEIRIVPVESF